MKTFTRVQKIRTFAAACAAVFVGGTGILAATSLMSPPPKGVVTPTPQRIAQKAPSAAPRDTSQTHVMQANVNCAPSALLVNPCRPWLGAATGGYPMAASDINSQLTFFNKRLNDTGVLSSPSKAVTINKKIDMAHVYHSQGSNLFSNTAQNVLNNAAFSQVMVNWKPLPAGYKWKDANGGNATVNAYIRAGANAVKSLGNRKIILAVWHEPENDVSSGNCTSNASGASMGSPAEYVQMWRTVRQIFNEQGVSNAVWAMNYMGFSKWNCLVPLLWPGNAYVDWVVYDPYASGSESFDTSVSGFYNFLKSSSNSTYNYASKPWGLAEHGYWNPSGNSNDANAITYWNQAKAAIQQNKFPNLKMYLVFDTSTNGTSQVGLKFNQAIHPEEQAAFNGFAEAVLGTASSGGGGSTPPPPAKDTTPPGVALQEPAGGATVQKTITVTATASDNVAVTRVQLFVDATLIKDDKDPADGWSSRWDTTKVSDGAHTLKAVAYDAAGNSRTATAAITIANNGRPSGGSNPGTGSGTGNTGGTPAAPAPTVKTPSGKPVANVQRGGSVEQGKLLVVDPTVATDPEVIKNIRKVEYYANGRLLASIDKEPFALNTKTLAPGKHTIKQVTFFNDGTKEEAQQTVTIQAQPVAQQRKTWWIAGGAIVAVFAGAYVGLRLFMRARMNRRRASVPTYYDSDTVDLPSSQVGPQVVKPDQHSGSDPQQPNP